MDCLVGPDVATRVLKGGSGGAERRVGGRYTWGGRIDLIKGTVAHYYSLKGELVRGLVSNCEMGEGQAGTELDSGVLRPHPHPQGSGSPAPL